MNNYESLDVPALLMLAQGIGQYHAELTKANFSKPDDDVARVVSATYRKEGAEAAAHVFCSYKSGFDLWGTRNNHPEIDDEKFILMASQAREGILSKEEVIDIISTLKGFSRPLAANNALFPKRH